MRLALTWMSALLLCGCLGRAKPDLLQARLREQQEYISEVERQMAATQADLKRARRDAEQLRAEMARSGKQVVPVEYSESLMRVRKLQISSLISGGLNRDDRPGDDAVVTLLSLVDDDSEAVKLPGAVDLTLIDPAQPEPNRQIGQWHFSPEECRSKWTRGFAGAGYQFTVPLDHPVQHAQLVLHARLTAADGRSFDSSQLVRVAPANESASPPRVAQVPDSPQELDDINDPPPPAVGSPPLSGSAGEPKLPEWDQPAKADAKPIQDSTNWEKDLVPQRR